MKAMQAALVLLLDVPLSMIADRRGRTVVLVIANGATAIWLATTAYSTSVTGFFIAEVFNAIGLAAFNGVFSAVLVKTYKNETQRNDFENILGWFGKWQFFLMAIAAAFGALFYDSASPAVWWLASGGIAILAITTPLFMDTRCRSCSGKRAPAPTANGRTESRYRQFRLAPRFCLPASAMNLMRRFKTTPSLAASIGALVAISLAFQVLLQFWQPVISSQLGGNEDVGRWFGASFVLFLLAQSFAAHCVRRSSRISHSRTAQLLFLLALATVIARFEQLPVISTIVIVAAGFFIVKGLSITLLADTQRLVPETSWSTAESAIGSVSRLLFIATMPLVGAFGDTFDSGSVLLVVFVLMVGAFLMVGLACDRKPS